MAAVAATTAEVALKSLKKPRTACPSSMKSQKPLEQATGHQTPGDEAMMDHQIKNQTLKEISEEKHRDGGKFEQHWQCWKQLCGGIPETRVG